ncbi:hypothetical protein QJQ45_007507, partial [Haematococcus lacustris]
SCCTQLTAALNVMAVEEGRRAEAWGKAHHLQKLRNWGEASMAAIGPRLRATALAATRRELPGRVVLVHEFRTSRVSSARTNVVQGQAESFRWLYPVRSMATRSRIRGLMCSTSNVIKRSFYDRDVSAALNIARIAAGPGRPRELSSWLGRPAMPNPGTVGQEGATRKQVRSSVGFDESVELEDRDLNAVNGSGWFDILDAEASLDQQVRSPQRDFHRFDERLQRLSRLAQNVALVQLDRDRQQED